MRLRRPARVDLVVGGITPSTNPGHLARARLLVAVDHLARVVAGEPVYTFAVVGRPAALLEPVLREVGAAGSASIVPDLIYGGSTLQGTPDKGSGVLAYCAEQGIDPARVLAVGDGANDLELLDGAAVACAVATATRTSWPAPTTSSAPRPAVAGPPSSTWSGARPAPADAPGPQSSSPSSPPSSSSPPPGQPARSTVAPATARSGRRPGRRRGGWWAVPSSDLLGSRLLERTLTSHSGRYSAGMDARGRAVAWDLEQQPECVADVPFEIKEELAEGHVEPDRHRANGA